MKMVKLLPEFEYFSVFLKIETFFSKIRSKVTDYAALNSNTRQYAATFDTNEALLYFFMLVYTFVLLC